ncbi:CerR family C-terminal domain-containing protein [Paracoccus sp. (in: a-proteobacteria)]|uniref:CerR family C-terminal domain-containing protein n=1 Tax=Paracoccus sp. TaxID=267 RepID=UPI003A86CF38
MTSPDDTPRQLIAAALHLFGHQGYAATTTRAIAARAGANIGLIAYHFGGKPQLRLACADEVVRRMSLVTAALEVVSVDTPDQAMALMDQIVGTVIDFMVADPASEDIAAFVLRELTEQGEVFDRLYHQVFESRHSALCRLWAMATGQDAESDEVKLSVFSMIGQVMYFRIGRPLIRYRMGWPSLGPPEARQIAGIVRCNLRAAIERSRP